MQRFRPPNLGNRITLISVGIAAGTALLIYVYTVAIGGSASGLSEVKGQIVVGGLLAIVIAAGIGLYYARLAGANIRQLEDAARKVADGNFETPIPISSAGQLGQLA
ncbi:MAG TPA: HAMP domain-containing protein, partial [Solirubrobacterales bacterium]|nr:HAMP domain-containing protein [Solirubrobacterales bacterium]